MNIIFTCVLNFDLLPKMAARERETQCEELREDLRGSVFRIASLESQLSAQTARADSLEHSFAAEIDKLRKEVFM